VSNRPGEFLLVRVGQRRLGLLLDQVLEVIQLKEVHPVPVVETAVRGLIAVHGRMLPLVHLGSLLEGSPPPDGDGGTMGVVVSVAGKRVCLEVEDAELLVREAVLPVPAGEGLPWAVGVARYAGGLVPLLDLPALSSRLTEAAAT
jgi:chemotaxis signal transduction protein